MRTGLLMSPLVAPTSIHNVTKLDHTATRKN
jgi:hypothetical protein